MKIRNIQSELKRVQRNLEEALIVVKGAAEDIEKHQEECEHKKTKWYYGTPRHEELCRNCGKVMNFAPSV
ncbi:MAG: hypothetical protein V1896_00540 [Candidatus Zambryskibacteria bacterium]